MNQLSITIILNTQQIGYSVMNLWLHQKISLTENCHSKCTMPWKDALYRGKNICIITIY